jgi:hypothetical protein
MVKEQEKRLLWDLRTNEALVSSRDGSLGMRRSRPEERPWLAAHLIRSRHFKHFIDLPIHHVTFSFILDSESSNVAEVDSH